jgi:hypothetical protein
MFGVAPAPGLPRRNEANETALKIKAWERQHAPISVPLSSL